jgi:hypothetical protein
MAPRDTGWKTRFLSLSSRGWSAKALGCPRNLKVLPDASRTSISSNNNTSAHAVNAWLPQASSCLPSSLEHFRTRSSLSLVREAAPTNPQVPSALKLAETPLLEGVACTLHRLRRASSQHSVDAHLPMRYNAHCTASPLCESPRGYPLRICGSLNVMRVPSRVSGAFSVPGVSQHSQSSASITRGSLHCIAPHRDTPPGTSG